jgi:circadian clock protein KaiB
MKKETGQIPQKRNKKSGAQSFSLYITGASPNSSRAVANIKMLFEKYLPGNHELDIIDVYQYPKIAGEVNIIALPMLVRHSPLPEKRLLGDMSNLDKMIRALSLTTAMT